MFDASYNPASPPQEICDWVWNGHYDEWVCNYYPVYNPNTAYRGNTTSVTAYANAAAQTGVIVKCCVREIIRRRFSEPPLVDRL